MPDQFQATLDRIHQAVRVGYDLTKGVRIRWGRDLAQIAVRDIPGLHQQFREALRISRDYDRRVRQIPALSQIERMLQERSPFTRETLMDEMSDTQKLEILRKVQGQMLWLQGQLREQVVRIRFYTCVAIANERQRQVTRLIGQARKANSTVDFLLGVSAVVVIAVELAAVHHNSPGVMFIAGGVFLCLIGGRFGCLHQQAARLGPWPQLSSKLIRSLHRMRRITEEMRDSLEIEVESLIEESKS